MKGLLWWLVCAVWLVEAGFAFAHEDQRVVLNEEQTLTGEVVAVFCYLIEGGFGTGREQAAGAQNCIRRGSPIAIKVGNQFYVVPVSDRDALKNRLTQLAGQQVTARGIVTRRDGQLFMAISHVERAKPKRQDSEP